MQTFKRMLKTSFTTITPIALCIGLAIAVPAMAKNGNHQKHDGVRKILSELSLTDTQKQDIKQILKETREDRALFSSDVKSLRSELRSLVQSVEWDQTAVESAIAQRQTLRQEKALQRATNRNQVWNLLTETQQSEFVAQLEAHKAERQEMDGENKKGKKKGKRKGNMLKGLDLSEEQISAAKAIKTAAKESGAATKAKLKAYKEAERALVQSTEFNAEAWQNLSSEYQDDFLAIAALKAKIKYDIWNLLTPEQQAQAIENKDKRSKGKKRVKLIKQQDA